MVQAAGNMTSAASCACLLSRMPMHPAAMEHPIAVNKPRADSSVFKGRPTTGYFAACKAAPQPTQRTCGRPSCCIRLMFSSTRFFRSSS